MVQLKFSELELIIYDNKIYFYKIIYKFHLLLYMKFIHFGCWNNGQCSSDGTNGLSLTMQKLNSYVKENSVDFITVAGDNYYPPKGSAGKKFIIEDFTSGFSCLPLTIKKYLIFPSKTYRLFK